MRRGDLFSAAKVRSSMEEITKLYATEGYVDMVPVPVERNDDRSWADRVKNRSNSSRMR